MGLLVNGEWQDKWYDTKKTGGRFERSKSQFRNWISKDGTAGPTGEAGFKAEPDRYHLYISLACPWANRTLIFRKLKGLESLISISIVHWYMGEDGWSFHAGEGVIADTVNHAEFMREIYLAADEHYTGRVTVPVLWDKQKQTIVSNESADIIRMFNSAFDELGATEGDYYPDDKRDEIELLNERIYDTINNGVYKCGFATTQAAYEEALTQLFDSLEWLEGILGNTRYLTGDSLTEADWRLFTTLVRFDSVYYGHFKCNKKQLRDFPNLWAYTRDLYQHEGIAETVNLYHIKQHYYGSHESINPSRIVPVGPDIDFNEPHDRQQLHH